MQRGARAQGIMAALSQAAQVRNANGKRRVCSLFVMSYFMLSAIITLSENDTFAGLLAERSDFACIALDDAVAFLPALIDNRAALALLDSAHPAAMQLILAAKTSAATRRVPIVFVSDDPANRASAISAGAERAIAWAELESQLQAILKELMRAPSPETLAKLDCECAETLPPLAVQGAEAFNRGEFYRQHDLFEELWVATDGPVRDLYRAILQVGVAYYQVERGNFRGALKMLQRSVQWLHHLPDSCQGIDVAAMRRDSYAVRAELQRLGAGRLDEFDRDLLKPLRWHPPQT